MQDNGSIPIWLQISEMIRIRIIAGKIPAGEKLPSVREIAVTERANPNTVQKALAVLEDEGLIFTDRTNGKFVTYDTAKIDAEKSRYAKRLASEYLSAAAAVGFSAEDAVSLIREEMK